MAPRSRRARQGPHDSFTAGRPNPPSLTAVADADTLERVFGALANETRRGILAVLHDWGAPLSSHDIAYRFDLPWQAVSRHLRILTEAGLIRCEVLKNGRRYSLDRQRLRRVAGRWIARVATEGTWTQEGKLVFDFRD
jgi:DNA-binding transcriptional ArsR family regulator